MILLFLILPFFAVGQVCNPPDYVNHIGDKIVCNYPDGQIRWVQYVVWEDRKYDFIRIYPDTQRACVSLYMDPTPGGCTPVHPETANFWVRVQMHAFGFVRVYGDCLFNAGVVPTPMGKLLYLYVYVAQLDKEYIYLIPDLEGCCSGGPVKYLLKDSGVMVFKERLGIE